MNTAAAAVMDVRDVINQLKTDPENGLSDAEAASRWARARGRGVEH